jgi:hypothetical protein
LDSGEALAPHLTGAVLAAGTGLKETAGETKADACLRLGKVRVVLRECAFIDGGVRAAVVRTRSGGAEMWGKLASSTMDAHIAFYQTLRADALVATQIGLPVVDRRPIAGVSGEHMVNMHLAQIYVP